MSISREALAMNIAKDSEQSRQIQEGSEDKTYYYALAGQHGSTGYNSSNDW